MWAHTLIMLSLIMPSFISSVRMRHIAAVRGNGNGGRSTSTFPVGGGTLPLGSSGGGIVGGGSPSSFPEITNPYTRGSPYGDRHPNENAPGSGTFSNYGYGPLGPISGFDSFPSATEMDRIEQLPGFSKNPFNYSSPWGDSRHPGVHPMWPLPPDPYGPKENDPRMYDPAYQGGPPAAGQFWQQPGTLVPGQPGWQPPPPGGYKPRDGVIPGEYAGVPGLHPGFSFRGAQPGLKGIPGETSPDGMPFGFVPGAPGAPGGYFNQSQYWNNRTRFGITGAWPFTPFRRYKYRLGSIPASRAWAYAGNPGGEPVPFQHRGIIPALWPDGINRVDTKRIAMNGVLPFGDADVHGVAAASRVPPQIPGTPPLHGKPIVRTGWFVQVAEATRHLRTAYAPSQPRFWSTVRV